jgi:hypothetical protein
MSGVRIRRGIPVRTDAMYRLKQSKKVYGEPAGLDSFSTLSGETQPELVRDFPSKGRGKTLCGAKRSKELKHVRDALIVAAR